MEDRIAQEGAERPGAALIGLAAIVTITAAWWALALWPAGSVVPEWLARTRAACFGARPGGLPDAGGWILLIGEPLGMLGVLLALWGRSLRRDLRWILAHRVWRVAGTAFVALALVGTALLGFRVARVWANGRAPIDIGGGVAQRLDRDPPAISLIDQHGRPTSFADLRGETALLTFAYGHCTTVCPAIVNELRVARSTTNRPEVPIVIITLDPWRDTPDRLAMMAGHWGLAPNDRVLSGSVADVERTLDVLGIGRRRDERTGDIEHGTTAMIVDRAGRIAWRIDGGRGGVSELLRRSR